MLHNVMEMYTQNGSIIISSIILIVLHNLL